MKNFIHSVNGDRLAVAGGIAVIALYVIAFVAVGITIS